MDLFELDFFTYILILMLIVGAAFVVYGCVSRRETAESDDSPEEEELVSLAKKLDTLESSVYEADEAVHMLGDMSKNVFKEFDSKYQELLFLYNLVDEKQKTLALTGSVDTEQNADGSSSELLPDPVVVREMLFPGETAAVPKQKVAAVTHTGKRAAPKNLDVVVGDNNKRPAINPKFAHVLQLSKDGKSVEDIARDLDMGKGEIMLILNLGGRRQNA